MTSDFDISMAVWLNLINRFSVMMLVTAAFVFIATVIGLRTRRKPPLGALSFSVLLAVASVYKLWGFLDYGYYGMMFAPLSEGMVLARYCASIALRVVGLVTAVGILFLDDRARRMFIGLGVLTLCLIYWKHPFYAFENIARFTEQTIYQKNAGQQLQYPLHPWISLIVHYAIDIIFSISAIYYFSKAKVKEQFH